MKVAQFYKGHVSGWLLAIVAIGLDIAAAYFVDDPSKSAKVIRWSAWLTSAAAIWLVFVAQYDAWKDEFEKREAEEAKNLWPSIQGEVFDFMASGIRGEGGPPPHCYTGISCSLYLCNERAALTTLKELRIDGSRLQPPAEFSKINVVRTSSPQEHPIRLDRGLGTHCGVIAEISFNNFWEQIQESLDLNAIKVSVIDSFGGEHSLLVRQGEVFRKP